MQTLGLSEIYFVICSHKAEHNPVLLHLEWAAELTFDLKGTEPGAMLGTVYQMRQAASMTVLSALPCDEEPQSPGTVWVLTSIAFVIMGKSGAEKLKKNEREKGHRGRRA